MSLGVLCPGQGGQGTKMLDLIDTHDKILELAEPILGASIRRILSDCPSSIYHNIIAQPLLCAVQLATWCALKNEIARPIVFAGYSVGELAAYGCVDALTPVDMLAVAAARAQFMSEACPEPCRMTAVRGLRRAMIERLATEHGVYLSIINEHDHFIVGGLASLMHLFEAAGQAAGACLIPLRVSVASHTPLMVSAAAALTEALGRIELRSPVIAVLSAIDGSPVMTAERVVGSLRDQLYNTVDWAACIHSLQEKGCTAVLELGPGDSLVRMVRRSLPDMPARSVSEFRTLSGVIAWVNKMSPDA